MINRVLTLALSACVVVSAAAPVLAAPPKFTHVYIIVMENEESTSIIGNPAAPYINSLAQQYALGTAYTGVSHPSLPNYMAMTGGNTAFTDDCVGCTVATSSIADQIEAAGRRWKAYMESMSSPCDTQDGDTYTTHHNPFIHYAGLVSNTSRCQSHVVPLTALATDVTAGTVPDYVWITPNLCSDMHDCSIATGDAWLKGVVPYIMSTKDFATSALFITWDEGTTDSGGGGVIPMIVVSPLAKKGFRSTVAENHYSLLRTIEDAWGLAPLGHASTAAAMTEYFTSTTTGVPGTPTSLAATTSGSTIGLTWKAPTTGGAPTNYVLQVGTGPGLTDIGSASTGSLATSLTLNNVTAGTYYLQVAAQNSAGTSAPSNQIAVAVLVPSSPTGLTATVNGTSLTLSWAAPASGPRPTAYVLEAGSAPGLSDLGKNSTGSTATTLTATSLPPGTFYARVRAQDSSGVSAPSNEVKVTVAGQTTARNPLTWPFSSDSIWNMPIGSRAVYGATGLTPAVAVYGDVDYFYALRSSDPLVTLFNDDDVWSGPRCSSTKSSGISLNVPTGLIVPDTSGSDTPNNSAAFLLPNGHTLEQVNALARCKSGGPIYGVPAEQNGAKVEDLYGSGITGGHAGSNLSSIGGTVRLGELTGSSAIRHALKIEVDGRYLHYSSQKPGFEWPATTADSCASSCYTGSVSTMVQGALLAIPPSATEQSLGLTTAPGKKLFHALQDYGAYIVDNSDDPSYNISVESGVKSEFKTAFGFDFDTGSSSPWLKDIAALFSNLRVITNNGPATIGGGGTPRAALAPAVASPASAGISATLSTSATTIASGASATLSWTVSGGTAAIDQGVGSVPLSGSIAVTPKTTTTYTLSASTNTGTVTRSVTVTVK
ncbi:MAG TPA: alkaline phosphatase family protein [Vicinamibacterales bacterium]|nr:alkaline phosphatase family protein [Vicinamibacterales bacterium]